LEKTRRPQALFRVIVSSAEIQSKVLHNINQTPLKLSIKKLDVFFVLLGNQFGRFEKNCGLHFKG
jgi:hypothetical protein